MEKYNQLLLQNRAWVEQMLHEDKNYFNKLANTQKPEFLWIGCADSRVPANQITGTNPGEVFVHRNIANMVVHTDMNMLSVLDYAVNVLEVNHVIVCGHYGCGGVRAAMGHKQIGLIDNWLQIVPTSYPIRASMAESKRRSGSVVDLATNFLALANVSTIKCSTNRKLSEP